jgi:hypothetical protein
MTRQALLRLLVEWARKEISLLMLKRHMAARHGHAHRGSRKLCQLAGLMADWLERRARADVARLDEYAEDAPAYPWNFSA